MTPHIAVAIRAVLMADPVVSSMVGERIYPQTAPQGSDWPCIVYSVRGEPEHTQAGRARFDRFQLGLDCWSREREGVSVYDEANDLARAVSDALAGYRGVIAGVRIQSCTVTGTYDDGADEETGIYSVGVDIDIWANKEP